MDGCLYLYSSSLLVYVFSYLHDRDDISGDTGPVNCELGPGSGADVTMGSYNIPRSLNDKMERH